MRTKCSDNVSFGLIVTTSLVTWTLAVSTTVRGDHPGWPHLEHIEVFAERLNVPAIGHVQEQTITVRVGDEYGDPVLDGMVVYFINNCGMMSSAVCYTLNGVCTNTLHTFDDPGFCFVCPYTLDYGGGLVQDSVRVLRSGHAEAVLSPLTFNIKDGGSQIFTYKVFDVFGNPLTKGTHITVQVYPGVLDGDIDVTLPDTQSRCWTHFSFRLSDDQPGDPYPPRDCYLWLRVDSDNGLAGELAIGTID